MQSVSEALQHLVHVTPSGCRHPYYAALDALGVEKDTKMLAALSAYPPLGEGTVVGKGKDGVCLIWFEENMQALAPLFVWPSARTLLHLPLRRCCHCTLCPPRVTSGVAKTYTGHFQSPDRV